MHAIRNITTHTAWRRELVATRNRAGLLVLVGAQLVPCGFCEAGVRLVSRWASAAAEGHHLDWCRTCFTAESEIAALEEDELRLAEAFHGRLEARPVTPWPAAGPALEDLLRRGLL